MKKIMKLMLLSVSVFTFIFLVSVSAATSPSDSSLNSQCSVDFKINTYPGGSTTNITITNLGDAAITNWKLTWTFNNSAQIGQLWCASYTQVDQLVVVTPLAWNQTIAPKSSICLGFCSTGQITQPNDLTLSLPNNVTAAEPIINSSTDATALVNANSQFAFAIFKQLNTTEADNNIFISPLSIATALAMLYQGASSDTRDEIAKTLHYSEIDIKKLNSAYLSLLNNLENVDPFVALNIANSIWYQKGFKVKPDFLNTNQFSCQQTIYLFNC